jgi:hypothetical protein
MIQNYIWDEKTSHIKEQPLLYFTDKSTYTVFLEEANFKPDDYERIQCANNLELLKLKKRLDKRPFHMENKMSFGDSTSMFYYRPMMLASDVETMIKYIPAFSTTEDWLQLVMHEYFHSFQFSHEKSIKYLSQKIQASADTLNQIFKQYSWFEKSLTKENNALLHAINTNNNDSTKIYIKQFISLREKRRARFSDVSDFNLALREDFWETIEGSARYVESYLAGAFKNMDAINATQCDTLFQHFAANKAIKNIEESETFIRRTEIMDAYYYVTGFNICRLLDKLGITYQADLFDNPENGLYQILSKET